MSRCFVLLLVVSVINQARVQAQAMDNTESYRNILSDKYFRINYENDFFSASDRDYTQGILIEKVHPAFGRFFLMKIIWQPKGFQAKYGVAIEHNAYTPNRIEKYDIQYGDRPFAGVLLFKTFAISANLQRKERIVSTLSMGVLGSASGGEQMQRTIHHWINYTQPEGWHNQIRNDFALNYQVTAEKRIAQWPDHFLLSAGAAARAGTLSDKLSAGLTAAAGKFQSPFTSVNGKQRFQWRIYWQVTANAVFYDATLQGGLFNRSSVYTIASSEISRGTLQNRYGLILNFKSLYLEYYRTGLTEEFKTSEFHRTGGLQVGFGF